MTLLHPIPLVMHRPLRRHRDRRPSHRVPLPLRSPLPSRRGLPALILLVAGCASSGSRAAEFTPLATPLSFDDRFCDVADEPATLPAPGVLIEADALASAASAPAAAVLSVRFEADGAPAWVEVLDDAGDEAGAARLAEVVRRSLRPQEERPEGWGVRLTAVGEPPGLAVSRTLYCPPDPISGTGRGTVTRALSSAEMRSVRSGATVEIEIRVGAGGVKRGVELTRRSGSRFWDEEMLEIANSLRFRPALQDGIPVAGVHTLRTRLRTGRP